MFYKRNNNLIDDEFLELLSIYIEKEINKSGMNNIKTDKNSYLSINNHRSEVALNLMNRFEASENIS